MIPVRYTYFMWFPPKLSEEEELAYGRKIAAEGRDKFVNEFRKNMWKSQEHENTTPASPLKIFLIILLFIAGIYFIFQIGKGPVFVTLMLIVLGIYFVSMHLAARSFEKWVDSLIGKYAAHIARGGQ